MNRGLGTQLRHLVELLDSAVEATYVAEGLAYRPRYTPVMRALFEQEPATIGQIAQVAGITQPAVTQTVALMVDEGLVTVEAGTQDGRQRLVRLTGRGRATLERVQRCWHATAVAAADLDADLAYPLSTLLEQAIAALEARPFGARIAQAKAAHAAPATDPAARTKRSRSRTGI